MTKSSLQKKLTLLSSVSLVTLFLLYRTSAFDNASLNNKTALQTSHNGGSINAIISDTTQPGKDTTHPLMLSSSKVLILTDKTLYSLKEKPAKNLFPKTEADILSSSKSSIIFRPEQPFKPGPDTIKRNYDSLKK